MTQMNLIYEIETITENRLGIAKVEEVGGGMEWDVGVSTCKLLYTKWINSKVLLQRGPMISHMEKNILKECTYI